MSNPGYASLTGYWSGAYTYPAGAHLPTTPFNATLEEMNGALIGDTEEPNTLGHTLETRVIADLVGTRTGHDVQFVKSMNGSGGANHDIVYQGIVTADFTRIDGTWTIPGEWSGGFWMERSDAQESVAASKSIEERV